MNLQVLMNPHASIGSPNPIEKRARVDPISKIFSHPESEYSDESHNFRDELNFLVNLKTM